MRPVWSSGAEGVKVCEITLTVAREVDIVLARVRVQGFARDVGFSISDQWSIAIAASEVASNIVKYGGKGLMAARFFSGELTYLELEGVDQGPGIADLALAMQDGVSEGTERSKEANLSRVRGLGYGLGTIARLMDDLLIETKPGEGTRVRAIKVWKEREA